MRGKEKGPVSRKVLTWLAPYKAAAPVNEKCPTSSPSPHAINTGQFSAVFSRAFPYCGAFK